MVGERRESNAPSVGDSYMPPSYDEVKGNGVSQSGSPDTESKPAKSLYFLAEVLRLSQISVVLKSACSGMLNS